MSRKINYSSLLSNYNVKTVWAARNILVGVFREYESKIETEFSPGTRFAREMKKILAYSARRNDDKLVYEIIDSGLISNREKAAEYVRQSLFIIR